jgi:hypothetical protein
MCLGKMYEMHASGLGRVHSDDGLREMCQTRHINYNAIPTFSRELWWYPYSEKGYQLIKKATTTLFSGGVWKGVRALFGSNENKSQ